jgi:RHS repeat-associated protein
MGKWVFGLLSGILVWNGALGAVGAIPASSAVTDQGAATYTIPLRLPNEKLVPNLALTYDHQRGDGLLGVGFAMSGFSVIQRCSGSGISAPHLYYLDQYCLDGNTLRLTGGTHGQPNSTFQTQLDTLARVTAIGSTNGGQGGPLRWEVWTHDGLIHEYATTSDSRVESVGSNAVPRLWARNRIRDRAGNYIDFVYAEDSVNGGYRPSEVRYGGNFIQGVQPSVRVSFVYETATRPDPLYAYRMGTDTPGSGIIVEFKRLDRIDVASLATAQIIRTYDLSYEASGGAGNRTRLASIQECVGADCLAPTSFQWINGTSGWGAESATTATLPGPNVTPLTLDFDNDGQTDVLYPSTATSGTGTWMLLRGSNAGLSAPFNTGAPNWNFAHAQAIHFDGDGREDLLFPCGNGSTWCVYFQRTGTAPNQTFSPTPFDTGISITADGARGASDWLAVDFNNDTYTDLVYIASDANGQSIRWYSNFAASFSTSSLQSGYHAGMVGFDETRTARRLSAVKRMDFSGNGSEGYFLKSSFLPSLSAGHYNGGGSFAIPSVSQFVYVGDFNGDSVTDMAFASTNWMVRYGTGYGFAAAATGPSASNMTAALVADFDGDGKSDILMSTSSSPNWLVARSTGNGLTAFTSTGIPTATWSTPIVGDFNGDGLDDIARVDTSTSAIKARIHNGVIPDLMDRVTDGFGNYADFDYASISQDGAWYSRQTPGLPFANFWYGEHNGPITVVSSQSGNDGTGGTYTISHSYAGGLRQHISHRSFQGFAQHIRTDSRDQSTVTEKYSQEFPHVGELLERRIEAAGYLLRTEKYTRAAHSFAYQALANHSRALPYVHKTDVENFDRSGGTDVKVTSVSTTNVVDTWGTLTEQYTTTTEHATGIRPSTYHVSSLVHSNVMNDTVNWCVGRVTDTQFTQHAAIYNTVGGPIRKSVRAWDGFYCRLTDVTNEPGHPLFQLATHYEYDDYGNVKTVTSTPVSGQGQSARSMSISWDGTGRNPISITDPLGKSYAMVWNPISGTRTSVEDPNGLKTSWEYDAFDRITKIKKPDGTAGQWTLTWCNTSSCQAGNNNLRTLMTEESLDTAATEISTSRHYLDSFKRELLTQRELVDGTLSNVRRMFNSRGQLHQESMPSLAIAPTQYTSIQYDHRGRPTLIRRPSSEGDPTNRDTTFSYEGLRTTTTDALGKATVTIADAVGAITRVTDPLNNSSNFDYDPAGNLRHAIDAAGNTLETGYDFQGRLVFAIDPDLGGRSYSYYPFGELKQEFRYGNVLKSFTYDALSRVLTKQLVDIYNPTGTITSTFVWGNSPALKNVGQLASMQISGAGLTTYAEANQYDDFGSLKKVTYTEGSSATHVFDFAYNSLTRFLEEITYPTSTSGYRFRVKYDYQNGYTKRAWNPDNNNQHWIATSADARGNVTSQTVGEATNGVTFDTVSDFDDVTGLLRARQSTFTSGANAGTSIANLGYMYDRVGNVLQRQDNQQGITENFFYDDVHRLDYSTIGSVVTDYGYDAIGNITSKSDVGTYSYTATVPGCNQTGKPRAVRTISNGSTTQTFCYDAFGNMTNRNGTALTWFANNLAKSITKDANNSSSFEYTPMDQRWRHVYRTNGSAYTQTYFGKLVERVVGPTTTDWKHYIFVNGEAIGVYVRKTNGAKERFFFVKDQLGSIAAISNADGTWRLNESFTAFGARRGANWTGNPTSSDLSRMMEATRRGFTMHEHLDSTGLIHMNGRVFDPVIARFASPDPYFGVLYDTQGLNRYSYTYNNPLSYTDPSGFLAHNIGDWDDDPVWDALPLPSHNLPPFAIPRNDPAKAPRGRRSCDDMPLARRANAARCQPATSPPPPPSSDPPPIEENTPTTPTTPNPTDEGPQVPPNPQPEAPDPTPGTTTIVEAASASTVSGTGGTKFENFIGEPFVTVGRDFGALAAYIYGATTGDQALKESALDGMRDSTAANQQLAISMILSTRGGARGAPRSTTDFVATRNGIVDVRPTIDRINSGGTFPHRNDGSIFGNREGLLPAQPHGYYREYVHPTPGSSGPGSQRIVQGQGGELYYTPDHYQTFIPLN